MDLEHAHNVWAGTAAFAISVGAQFADVTSGISLGQAAVVGLGIWYIAARLERQDSKLEEINRRLDSICPECPLKTKKET